MDLQDKILNAVLDIQNDLKDVKGRVLHIEESQARAYKKLVIARS